jgi:cell division protein FtsA
MEMIDNELAKSGKKEILAAGVVLTGGGSMIEGTVDAAERVLNMPVRVGLPENIVGLKDVVSTPMYANGVGLLRYGAKMGQLRQTRKTPGGLKSLKDKLRQIFNDYL